MATSGGQWALDPSGLPAGGWAPTGRAHADPAPKPGTVPLRRLDASDILRGVFATVRRYPKPLYLPLLALALGSAVLLGGCVCAAWFLITHGTAHGGRPFTSHLSGMVTAGAVVLVPALICATVAYAVTATVSITVLGRHAVLGRRPPTARQAWTEARPYLWRVLGTQLLTSLAAVAVMVASMLPAILLGVVLHSLTALAFGLLLLIPGVLGAVYAGGRLVLAVPVVVLENRRPVAALRRAWKLSHAASWRTLGIACLTRMICYTATQPAMALAGTVATRLAPPGVLDSSSSGQSSTPLTGLILPAAVVGLAAVGAAIGRAPLTPLTLGLLYTDRRIRLEQLDTGLAAAVAGPTSHAPFATCPAPSPVRRTERPGGVE
ncbi:hypothetical protein [Streptomyces sp. NBC_01089]|uniref:hypothetical protein n=1 Tax=Streptomyces sp. NBC_01089 TaxID=2903747 RepID=UPI003870465D|nr:hypothetical protein OG510_06725 [Streptomyces sp. NBC_01089]